MNGVRLASQYKVGVAPSGTALICNASAKRVAITFSANSSACVIGNNNAITTTHQNERGAGLFLTTSNGPITLTREIHGSAVMGEWWMSSAGNATVHVIETMEE